ncbi:hypothetical protein N7497_006334 [Penicillium chrysogenum]|nr:hypothetical protein N7497_006334 [Penicillium chrysogenum]
MRIISVNTYIVRGTRPDWRHNPNRRPRSDQGLSCLVRIETETGVVGWGEGLWLTSLGGGSQKVREIVDTVFGPVIIGRDPTAPMDIWKELQTLAASTFHHGSTYDRRIAPIAAISAIDIALWDITGKAKGQPVHKLLSNVVRSKIKVCVDVSLAHDWEQRFSSDSAWQPGSFSVPQPEAQFLLDRGFDTFEISIRGPLERSMRTVRAIRGGFGPQASIVVKNHTMGAPAEEITLKTAQDSRRLWPGANGNRAERSFAMAWLEGDVDILQPNITICGGFTALLRILTIAESHDVLVMPCCPMRHGSGIALAATIQAAAAVPWMSMEAGQEPNPKEPMISLSTDVLDMRNRFLVENIDGSGGYLHVSESPGLGSTVDEQALSRLTIQ